MRKTTTLLCLIFSAHFVTAQLNKGNYNSLLWRISGNGLTKPSYVFGTMHITDKRVFYFTDSLYKSLEQSEGFAAELDINNLFSEHFGGFLDDKKEGVEILIIDSVDKKILADYKKDLEKKFKKPVNKITIADINDAADEWMKGIFKKGEMNTVMDAWLFDIAKRQGKWVGGIEDFQDQEGLKDSITILEKFETIRNLDKADSMINWMIDIYVKQQLDVIDRSENIWQGSRDALLIRRNIKMASRMDSLAQIRSVFFAIGAAHIPGEDGVIDLLRQKGYTLTPVHSKNRIAPENYTYKQVDLPWYNVNEPADPYKLMMPGKPLKQFIDGEDSPEMKLYMDMGYLRAYFTLAIPIPETSKYSTDAADSTLINLVQYYKETMMVTETNIIVNGIKGKEIVGRDREDAEIRMQLFAAPSLVVLNGISGFKKNTLYGEEPERFFTSFQLLNKPNAAANTNKKNWQRYAFKKFGFSVELPSKYLEEKIERDDEMWEQKFYKSIDPSTSTFLGIIISSIKKGYYSNSDSVFFEDGIEAMLEKMNADLISKEHLLFQGYPAFSVEAKTSGDKDKFSIRVYMVNKGARRYMLFTTFEPGSRSNPSARFFESFRFLSEESANWSRQSSPDKSFSIWSPNIILNEHGPETVPNETKYFVLDTNSNLQVFIDKETFPSYFWAEDDTTFLKDKTQTYIGVDDSTVFNELITAGKLKGIDLLMKLKGTHNLKRLRAILNGDTLYTIYTFLPAQNLETANYQKMFDEFSINFQSTTSSLFKRKPGQLLTALQTKDSSEFENANDIFEYINFIKEDLPLLQRSLLYQHYDFDTTYYYNLNQSIADWIEKLDSNHTSIEFAKEHYPTLTGDKEYMKPFVLGLLSRIKTRESYSTLKKLIIESPPAIAKEYYWRNGLYDSLSLTNTLFPEILTLAGDAGTYDFINDLTLRMLDSGLINADLIRKHKNVYIETGKRIVNLPSTEQETKSYCYASLAKLLGKINDAEGNAILRKLGEINANSLKLDVVLAQAAAKQQPDQKNIKLLAASDEFRQQLYTGLSDIKRIDLFPKEFLNQRSLAQSFIYGYANEDDYPPDTIEFLGERIETYLGKKQKFYLFKICFKNEEDDFNECHFAVAGPYSPDPKNLASKQEVTEINWDDEFDSTMINEWLKDMIKRTEDWIKERDAKKDP